MRTSIAVTICLLLGACATPPPPAAPLPPPPPIGEPGDAMGLTASQVRTEFGKPSFVRTENGSEIWRYDGVQCRAFFFLYPKGDSLGVRHVETLPHGKEIAADLSCLAALRRRPAS